jgi:hypothetical protein
MTELIPFTEECLVCDKSHSTEDEFIQCVETNIYNIDWYWISMCQQLSESFIEKYEDKVIWLYISQYQTLSKTFIEKFQNEIDWWYVSKYQNLSKEFIEEFLIDLDNPTIPSKSYIENYKLTIINNNIETAIKKNNYSQQYKKHILTILQEDKIGLTEKFKNELFTLILKEV